MIQAMHFIGHGASVPVIDTLSPTHSVHGTSSESTPGKRRSEVQNRRPFEDFPERDVAALGHSLVGSSLPQIAAHLRRDPNRSRIHLVSVARLDTSSHLVSPSRPNMGQSGYKVNM